MHLFNCLDPVAVTDHNGDIRYVPCGKCDYCRHVRSLSRTERATNEMRSHKFCLFLTLTYHDALLPLLHIDYDHNLIYFDLNEDSFCGFSDTVSGLCQDYFCPSEKERVLYDRITSMYGGIPVLYYPDVQRFLKRLRIHLFRNYANKDKQLYNEKFKITYSLCGEYGPSTYRPHIHLLLFFDEQTIAERLPKDLRSLWEFGIVTQRFVSIEKEDAHYTAKYANSIARLPSLYQQKMVAPFYRTSKTGSFGFSKISSEEIQNLYRSANATVTVEDMLSGETKSVPVPVYIENKLFPRFSGFDFLGYNDALRLLRLSIEYQGKGLLEFERAVHFHLETHSHYDISKWYHVFLSGINYGLLCNSESEFEVLNAKRRRYNNLCRSLYYCGKRYLEVCQCFGVSLNDALLRTHKYFYNKSHLMLKRQFEFEDEFYEDHPEWLFYLEPYPHSMDVIMSTEFADIVHFVEDNINHSHKNRRKNEFLAAHPEYSYINEFDDCDIDRLGSFVNRGIV